jgi:hypothetical protein
MDAHVSEREGFPDEDGLVVGGQTKARQTARETRLVAVNQRVAARFEGGHRRKLAAVICKDGRRTVTTGRENHESKAKKFMSRRCARLPWSSRCTPNGWRKSTVAGIRRFVAGLGDTNDEFAGR